MRHTTVERLVKDLILLSLVGLFVAVSLLFFNWAFQPTTFIYKNDVFLILAVVGITFLIYRLYDQKITGILNRTLFMPQHIRRIQVAHLDEEMLGELDIEKLSDLFVDKVVSIFGAQQLALFILDEERDHFYLIRQKGIAEELINTKLRKEESVIQELCEKRKNPIYKKSYHFLSWQDAVEVEEFFERYQAKTILPFFCDNKLVAFLTLGQYQKIQEVNQDIANFYYSISKYAGFSFKNAIRLCTIRNQILNSGDTQGVVLQKLKLEAIDKLATGIAHEIRNPLAIISLRVQSLLRKKGQTYEQNEIEKTLELTKKQIDRASEITKRLIRFGRKVDKLEDISFFELMDEITKTLSYHASSDDIKIIQIIDPQLPKYRASISELRELFLNVVLNAIDAVGKEGSIFVYIQYQASQNRIAVHIVDNGKGALLEEDPSAVFDPFFTMKDNQNVGLGLYNCQKIVNKYGGSIRFEKNEPTGVDVYFTLPIQQKEKEEIGFATFENDKGSQEDGNEILPFEMMREIVFKQQEVAHDKDAGRG